MLLTFVAMLAAPVPRPCGAPCRAAEPLAAVKARLAKAIETGGGGMDRPEEDLAAWKKAAAEVVDLWSAYRDARCDGVLLRLETGRGDAAGCQVRIGLTAASDLSIRYELDPKARRRADVETLAQGERGSAEDEGPCADAQPAECDYCGINHCWEARLKKDDAALNAAWRRALARITEKSGLAAAARTDWEARLRQAQRAWLRWRDADCELERLETPNPNAHSIFSMVTAPCLAAEMEARTAVLERTYGR